MLKLYYSPGACSLVPHVALQEAGADFDVQRVMVAEGSHLRPEYLAVNPHARVPALRTEKGVITENIAVLNFIADRFESAGSIPHGDPYATARVNELLGWFSSSVHISFAQVWRGCRFTEDEMLWPALEWGGRKMLRKQFDEIDALCVDEWLAPGGFSAADTYALTFMRWAKRIGFDIAAYPRWVALSQRVMQRPAVQRAFEREGLTADAFLPDAVGQPARVAVGT